MSISAIGFNPAAAASTEVQKPSVPAASSQPQAATLQPDTVNLSSAAHAASPAGDVDHDGDSH
jgi:hypothetical protein